MREHEVPTHVQAEDRVLLWFTFPQIVATTAVAALCYGAYRYFPAGPSELRMALAAALGLAGIAMIAGRIGGRRLPLVAADLLRFGLGARRYAGPPSELVRAERPAPAQPAGERPERLQLLVSRARRALRRTRRVNRRRKEGERRNGRMPFRRYRLFGKRRGAAEPAADQQLGSREEREPPGSQQRGRGRFWRALLPSVSLAVALATVPATGLAQGPGEEGWYSDEIQFRPPPVVPGRRLYVEALTITADRAAVSVRSATDLQLRVRAYGGPLGQSPRFFATAALEVGERAAYDLPLHGPSPSLQFSWEDALGQAGALTLAGGEQFSYPLPSAGGEFCDLRLVSLGWTAGVVEGALASTCATTLEEVVDLQSVAGHADVTTTALLEGEVVAVTGTVTVLSGASEASVTFVAAGQSRFRLPVALGEAVHALAVEADLEASLRIGLPPLVEFTHHPRRTEQITETAEVSIPAFGDTVTETFAVPNEDGTFTEHTVTASCHVPASTVRQDVVFSVVHAERVDAAVAERAPLARVREERITLAPSIRADHAYVALVVPEPRPQPEPSSQSAAEDDELRALFEVLGWEWPW